jgi:hypothetical protein
VETTLHRELKDLFSEPGACQEQRVAGYRIDVVNGNRLTEIQFSGLAAIRDKIRTLLAAGHLVDVVKPIVARKLIVSLARKNGRTISQRWSPLRGKRLDLFTELLHFATVFPHPGLRLVTPLVEVEETRYPGHGRRRRWRRNDHVVQDCRLLGCLESHEYRTVADLQALLPALPAGFGTADLADGLGLPRWRAQQVAWVLRQTGAVVALGRDRKGVSYRLVDPAGKERDAPARETNGECRPSSPRRKRTVKAA